MDFQDPSDLGEKRHSPTPTPLILESNLDKFLQQWKDAIHDGQKVLNGAALKEVNKILVHMKKGCLSGIQPSRGTNSIVLVMHTPLNHNPSDRKLGEGLGMRLMNLVLPVPMIRPRDTTPLHQLPITCSQSTGYTYRNVYIIMTNVCCQCTHPCQHILLEQSSYPVLARFLFSSSPKVCTSTIYNVFH